MVTAADIVEKVKSIGRPTMPSLSAQPKLFNASSYAAKDPFSLLTNVPRLTDSEANERIKGIKEQINALKVALEQTKANKMLQTVEGASMDASYEWTKNQLKRSNYQADLVFEADKLNNKQSAHKSLLQEDKTGWDLKIQGAKEKNEHSRNKLELTRTGYKQELDHIKRKLEIDKAGYSSMEGVHQDKWNAKVAQARESIQGALRAAGEVKQLAQTLEAEIVG